MSLFAQTKKKLLLKLTLYEMEFQNMAKLPLNHYHQKNRTQRREIIKVCSAQQ